MNFVSAPCFALLLAAPMGLQAQDDPLKSPACGQALAALQSARVVDPQRSGPLRDRAAAACLGSASLPQRSARVLQAPIVVPPPVITPPALPPQLAAPTLPPPPVAIGRLPAPALCDAGGCWAEDGGRLRHVGPNLSGPRGLCTPQSGLVYCP